MSIAKKYINIWLVFVQIKAEKGKKFIDLVELPKTEKKVKYSFQGAWTNVLIKASTIEEAIRILPLGLKEKSFDVVFVDKIEKRNKQKENLTRGNKASRHN